VYAGEEDHAWHIDNIKALTGLSVEETIRMKDDGDKWRKYVHGVTSSTANERNRTEQRSATLRRACRASS